MGAGKIGTTSFRPTLSYRVLATDWEAESYTECWCQDMESALRIAALLGGYGVSVQIDRLMSLTPTSRPK